MASTRIENTFSYRSIYSNAAYYYEIVVDQSGNLSLRNIRNNRGLIIDSMSSLPKPVVDDINSSMGQVENLMALTSAVNGTISFSNETTKSVVFAEALASATYRVYINIGDFISWRITSQTAAGFTVDLSCAFTGTVKYDVLV